MNNRRYEFEIEKSLGAVDRPKYYAIVWEHITSRGYDDIIGSRLFDTAADANAWLHEQARFLGINNTFEINRTLGH